MANFEENLFTATSICDGKFKYLDEFSRIYSFTTENISDYMKYFDFHNKKLLTVGSSGDQVLNAFYEGAKDITLFDINPYAKYYIYLKIAGILSFNYKEFQLFFFKHINSPFKDNKNMFSKILFDKIKDNLRVLDYESYLFFDELFTLFDPFIIRSRLFDDDENRLAVIKGFNNYLKDEESYNNMKIKIKNIYFRYINGDIFKDNINGIYDNIFLSNLCSVVGIDELKMLLEKIDKNNLNSNGSLLIGYLWDTNFMNNSFEEHWKDIYKLPIVKEKIGKFITEQHNIIGDRNILWNSDKNSDLILIYRK